jgi:hypothetical protein
LVSAGQTEIVDSSYKVLTTLPGGVSAAFSKRSDNVVVLSASGGDSVLTFSGFIAPEALKLTGAPRALTALPDGGYLVLVDLGGRGRVSKITREGTVFASVEVAPTTGDLIYDETTNRFTVASNGRRRLQHRSHPDCAKSLEQAAPGLDGAWHRHTQRAAFRHRLVTTRPDLFDGGELPRAPGSDQPNRRRRAGRPDDCHQVSADRGHVRIDHAQHRIRGNRGIYGIASVAQNLRSGLACEAMWCGDDPLSHLDRLSRSDELDRARLNLEKRRQEAGLLAVEVDAHLLR